MLAVREASACRFTHSAETSFHCLNLIFKSLFPTPILISHNSPPSFTFCAAQNPLRCFLFADGYVSLAPISQGGKFTGVAHRFDWFDRLTSWGEILINGLQRRLLAVLDSHQLGGHIPVIEFSAFRTSLFKPNLIGPFTDALFDVTHKAYLVAIPRSPASSLRTSRAAPLGRFSGSVGGVTSCRNCFPERSFALDGPAIFASHAAQSMTQVGKTRASPTQRHSSVATGTSDSGRVDSSKFGSKNYGWQELIRKDEF